MLVWAAVLSDPRATHAQLKVSTTHASAWRPGPLVCDWVEVEMKRLGQYLTMKEGTIVGTRQ